MANEIRLYGDIVNFTMSKYIVMDRGSLFVSFRIQPNFTIYIFQFYPSN